MKVLMINSGHPVYSYELCSALKKRGVDVSLVVSRGQLHPECFDGSFNIKELFLENDAYAKKIINLYKYIKICKPDVLHFQSTFSPRRDWFFSFILKNIKSKVIYTVHNIVPHEPALFEKTCLKIIYHNIPAIIVHANRNKKTLVKEFYIEEKKIHVIPQGPYNFYKKFDCGNAETLKTKFPLNNKRIILFFGAIRRNKGLRYLLEAMPKVLNVYQDVCLLIAGPIDPNEKEIYFSCIKKLNISENVITNFEVITPQDVPKYFNLCEFVVLPYTNITQSGVIFTAMVFKKPAIVTDVGGLPEVIENNKNGLVVPPEDPEALSHAILTLLSDRDKIKSMGEYNYFLGQKKYSWDIIAEQTLKIYQT